MGNDKFEFFIKKHGINTFKEIQEIICKEKGMNSINDDYLLYIFEIATCEFWGLNTRQTKIFIEKNTKNDIPNIEIEEIKQIHKNSILKIQKYLKEATKQINPN